MGHIHPFGVVSSHSRCLRLGGGNTIAVSVDRSFADDAPPTSSARGVSARMAWCACATSASRLWRTTMTTTIDAVSTRPCLAWAACRTASSRRKSRTRNHRLLRASSSAAQTIAFRLSRRASYRHMGRTTRISRIAKREAAGDNGLSCGRARPRPSGGMGTTTLTTTGMAGRAALTVMRPIHHHHGRTVPV